VEIPALSAYIEYLTGRQQHEIDLLTGELAKLSAKLHASGDKLSDITHDQPNK
jgi:hypothetical protein